MPERHRDAKQRLLVQEYLVDKNAARAAREDGYSAKPAWVTGEHPTKKATVADEITLGLKAQAENDELCAANAFVELFKVELAEMGDAYDCNRRLLPL